MTHDPLCPNIPEGWDAEASILWPSRCHCDLIAQVRKDERERAGIQQTVPSQEYPFSTSVTVEAAMTDMDRFKWTSFGPWLDEDGPWVRHADAEAAIAAAGADMLAKCITAVEQLTFYSGDDKEQVLALLQLQVKSLQ